MKKRVLSLVLSMILCFGIFFVTPVSASAVRGDIDANGVIDMRDLLVLRKHIAELVELTDAQLSNADCDGDQTVNVNDILTLRKYLVKLGELYKTPGWTTIYDWESEKVDCRPSQVTAITATPAVAAELDGYGNRKNPESKKSLLMKSLGVYYENHVSGTNPTCAFNFSDNAPVRIQVIANNKDTLLQNATNLRTSLKHQPIKDELSVIYVGFAFAGLTNFYYTRLTLESYNDFNYFYFVGKEYCKVDTKGSRRTFLENESVEKYTLTKEDVSKIKFVCFWMESNQGTAGAPFYIDDIEFYEGVNGYDSSAEDAALPQPETPVSDGKDKYIAISFDDGPQVYSPTGVRFMDYYLDVAKEYDAKFSFFLIGSNCGSDDIPTLKRAVEEGHALENHTMGHNRLSKISAQEGAAKITELDDWLYTNVGVKTKYIRPPYLDVDGNAYSAMELAGMKAAIGGPCPQDYNNPSVDYKVLYYQKHLGDGVISLNHEHYIDNVETIRLLLEHFTALGYKFVTIDELFAIKGVTPTLGKKYSNVND